MSVLLFLRSVLAKVAGYDKENDFERRTAQGKSAPGGRVRRVVNSEGRRLKDGRDDGRLRTKVNAMPKSDKTRQLRIAQRNAIELLLAGKTDQEVAEAVGVSRQTVTVWRNRDALFQTALEVRRKEIWGAHVERLRQIAGRAVEVLEADLLQEEDRRLRQSAAVHVLKCVGLYGANLDPKTETPGYPFSRWSDERVEKALRRYWGERGNQQAGG